jgi:hypothetical protein
MNMKSYPSVSGSIVENDPDHGVYEYHTEYPLSEDRMEKIGEFESRQATAFLLVLNKYPFIKSCEVKAVKRQGGPCLLKDFKYESCYQVPETLYVVFSK